MDSKQSRITRRALLVRTPAVVACLAAVPLVIAGSRAQAAKLEKSDVHYQGIPKDGKRCADCAAYLSAATSGGACRVVDGSISPEGWCVAYSPRA